MTQIKRHRIDWDNIKITFVPADKENPNPLNPYARMTPEEREEKRVSICAEIWVRAVRDKLKVGIKPQDLEESIKARMNR